MIGLMQKDLYLLQQTYKKSMVYIAALYLLLSVALKMPTFVQLFGWVLGFYMVSTVTMDNTSKWDLYATSLPVNRHQIVSSKYLLTMFLLLVGQVFSLGCTGLLKLLGRLDADYSILETLLSCSSTTMISLLLLGLYLCLSYRFGVEKSRTIIMMLGVVMMGALFFFISTKRVFPQSLIDLIQQKPTLVFGSGAMVFWPLFCQTLLSCDIYFSIHPLP